MTTELTFCVECGGEHEPSGARIDCLNHWKRRAVVAENALLVKRVYGINLAEELGEWLKTQDVNGGTIGNIRRQCFVPWDSEWNSLVRDATAQVERPSIV